MNLDENVLAHLFDRQHDDGVSRAWIDTEGEWTCVRYHRDLIQSSYNELYSRGFVRFAYTGTVLEACSKQPISRNQMTTLLAAIELIMPERISLVRDDKPTEASRFTPSWSEPVDDPIERLRLFRRELGFLAV